MSIKINIPPNLQHLADGLGVVEVHGSTVGQCLNHLVEQCPGIEKALFDKNGNLLNYIDIYVNGESAYPEESAKSVEDGDELSIVLVLAGG